MKIDYLKLHVPDLYKIDDLKLLGKVVVRNGVWLYVKKDCYQLAFDLLGARASRIDFCVDSNLIYTGEFDVMISSKGGGLTYYLGSRRSDRFYRIYNKTAQLGDNSEKMVIRYELECKGKVAKDAFWSIQDMLMNGVPYSDAVEIVGHSLDSRGIFPDKENELGIWKVYENKKASRYNWERIFDILLSDNMLLERFMERIEREVENGNRTKTRHNSDASNQERL